MGRRIFDLKDAKNITVIGAGTMGHGIAQVCAHSGCNVNLSDISKKVLDKALDRIRGNLELLAEEDIIQHGEIEPTLARITPLIELSKAVGSADLIIEAVPEDVNLKKKVLGEAERHCPKDTIVTTSTSVIRISEISNGVKRRTMIIGTHWTNPPYIMPLVEIIRGPETSDEVAASVKRFLEEKCGKRTITCKDVPGFVINRLGGAVLAEAARILEEGTASIDSIDKTWTEHLGILFSLTGPLQNADFIGLDVVSLGATYLSVALKDNRFKPPKWLLDKVNSEQLGVKTGRGIYDYGGRSSEEVVAERVRKVIKILKTLGRV